MGRLTCASSAIFPIAIPWLSQRIICAHRATSGYQTILDQPHQLHALRVCQLHARIKS